MQWVRALICAGSVVASGSTLASGEGPFTLAAGAAGLVSAYLPLPSLMPGYQPGQENTLPLATLQLSSASPVVIASSTADGRVPTRSLVLWGVLIAGALALGGALGTVAVIIRQEIVLFIMGGIFVVETVSVIMQVSYFKFTKKRDGIGKRLFLMAPLHHHFEQKGWKETQVVVRFWIITMLLVLVGLSSLKLR